MVPSVWVFFLPGRGGAGDRRMLTFGAFMSRLEDYRRRATECLAFAKISRDEEERSQLLIMASTLQRLAVEREKRPAKRARANSGTPPV
jgi:hypothetical protein